MNYPAFVLSVACATFPVLVVLLVYLIHRVNELEGLLDAFLHPVTTWRHKRRRHRRLNRQRILPLTLLTVLSLGICAGQSPAPLYTGFIAGSSADTYYRPITTLCKFSGSTPLNPVCMGTYTDPVLGSVFYGYGGLPYSYAIPVLVNGTCDLLLTSFEPSKKTLLGQRVFIVEVAGRSPVTIDLVALAGAKAMYSWIIPSIPVVDLYLHINFRPVAGNALINSIQWTCH